MSCLPKSILPQLAAISGLAADRLEQMLDTARRTPLPPLPLDPAVVDAMLAGRLANHDPKQVTAMLQAMAQGLRLALRQSRDRPPTAQELALLTALTGTVLPDVPPPDPALVQAMRTNLCLRPAPLPLTLPDDPDARRQAVLAAARVEPWTDDEANRIANDPTLVGLAWALGVRHPRIHAAVDASIQAAAAALIAGAADPDLLRRVVMDDSPHWAVQVLETSNRTDPALMRRAAEEPRMAAWVLVARHDLTDPDLITAAALNPWTAARVLAKRQDLTRRSLIRAAAEEPSAAAEVLAARHDITDRSLVTTAAAEPLTAMQVLVARHDITDPALIRAAARNSETAMRVLVARPDLTDPDLIRAAARNSEMAMRVLVARHDITDPDLIRAAARNSEMAMQVLVARHDITDPQLIAAAAREPWEAAQVLIRRPSLTTAAFIMKAAEMSEAAAQVLAARQDLTNRVLIDKSLAWSKTAVQVLVARRDLRSQHDILFRVRSNRDVAYAVVDALGPYPALWHALPMPLRDELADHFQMTPAERAWIDSLATRTPPVWTEADDQMAARFPWHHALREHIQQAGPPVSSSTRGGVL